MKINNEIIQKWGQEVASTFSNVANQGVKKISVYEIDCTQLEERFIYQDIRDKSIFSDMFGKLINIQNNPCVYFFEIVSDISPEAIVANLQILEGRTKPSIKKKHPQQSKVLYVGKVKSIFWGRLIMHMGFHTNKKREGQQSIAHGLQLRHWAKSMELKLKLHVYEFEPEMADYMEIIERLFAKQLNPIIGRH